MIELIDIFHQHLSNLKMLDGWYENFKSSYILISSILKAKLMHANY